MSDFRSPVDVSIVIPCYRSGPWLGDLVQRVQRAMEPSGVPFEIVLVNDGSGNETAQAVERLAGRHPQVRGFDLFARGGQHRATICGLEQARGAILVTMDDDLQQPPEEIPALLQALSSRDDWDCVMGAFRKKQHGWLRNLGSSLMSRLFQTLYDKPPQLQATSFRAMRRQLAEAICAYGTVNPNINPLIFQTTRRIGNVEVDHQARAAGRSGYSLPRLFRLMLDNVLSVSTFPLKCVSLLGLVSAIGSACLGAYYLVRYLSGTIRVAGFATQVLLTIFFGGMILFSVGLLGEYIIRIMEEVRGRPRYVIRREFTHGQECREVHQDSRDVDQASV